ncbi:MAG TPA: hypothetical protein VMU68_05905 [Acidimicrobiales bacterium]|nr:hypothetical protein [Acidimicrobiales bacterium]
MTSGLAPEAQVILKVGGMTFVTPVTLGGVASITQLTTLRPDPHVVDVVGVDTGVQLFLLLTELSLKYTTACNSG